MGHRRALGLELLGFEVGDVFDFGDGGEEAGEVVELLLEGGELGAEELAPLGLIKGSGEAGAVPAGSEGHGLDARW